MNTPENTVAAKLLEEITNAARLEPDKAKVLAETYRTLCEAYATRAKAEAEINRTQNERQ